MIEMNAVIQSFEALAHKARLEVFMLLVQAGPDGVAAGELAQSLGIAPNTLSFHLTRLRHAGLVESWRRGRQIIYAADFDRIEGLQAFLADNCCHDSVQACTPACAERQASGTTRSTNDETLEA